MDIDICGPSLPLLFGMQNSRLHSTSSGILPISVSSSLSLVSIGFLLPSQDSAVIWRGPKKNGIIKQFMKDVDWGQLEHLVIDTPPGTSDEHLSIVQYLSATGELDGAIIVTTPQEVSLQDVRKELDFCKKLGVPILGVVENMSGFVCPSCGGESDIFVPSTGGAESLEKEWGVELLGKVPLDPRIGRNGDFGGNFLEEYPESPATEAYRKIVSRKYYFHSSLRFQGIGESLTRSSTDPSPSHFRICRDQGETRQQFRLGLIDKDIDSISVATFLSFDITSHLSLLRSRPRSLQSFPSPPCCHL